MDELFLKSEYRHVMLEIIQYLSYDELINLLYTNKQLYKYVKDLLVTYGNYLRPILNQRFLKRKRSRVFCVENRIQNLISFNDVQEIGIFKPIIPAVDKGDLVYSGEMKKLYIVLDNLKSGFYVKPDPEKINDKQVFPIDYWSEISKRSPFRIWVPVYTDSKEDLEKWMKNTNRHRFINEFITHNQFMISYNESGQIYFY
jgi:hypothetical protein